MRRARGLYCDRRALRKLDALVVRHIGDRPEDRKFKVLPMRAGRRCAMLAASPTFARGVARRMQRMRESGIARPGIAFACRALGKH